jgi:hypothetical protein
MLVVQIRRVRRLIPEPAVVRLRQRRAARHLAARAKTAVIKPPRRTTSSGPSFATGPTWEAAAPTASTSREQWSIRFARSRAYPLSSYTLWSERQFGRSEPRPPCSPFP